MEISIELKPEQERRTEQFVPEEILPFGKIPVDHMFMMEHIDGEWRNPVIKPRGPFGIMPESKVYHYAHEYFEGSKAFMHEDGEIYTFRFEQNAKRLNQTGAMFDVPTIPVEDQVQALHTLLDVERLWYPEQEDASIYIRPYIIGVTEELYLKPGVDFIFAIVLSPSGSYFPGGFNDPSKFLITKKFKRVPQGGTGKAKTGGNYNASIPASKYAKREFDADQVVYLDPANQTLEEAGSNNIAHVTKAGDIIIPAFTENILESITSRSVLELATMPEYEIRARQETVYYDEFIVDLCLKEIPEAMGLGTAASVMPVGKYVLDNGREITVGDGNVGEVTKYLYDTITGIQRGRVVAPKGWLRKVERKV